MSRKPKLLAMYDADLFPRTEAPSKEAFQVVPELVRDLKMNTYGLSFKIAEPLQTPVLTPENVEFISVAWVNENGAFAACAQLGTTERSQGRWYPIIDVYRVCRFDLELHNVDVAMAHDAWATLTATKRVSTKLVLRQDGVWQEPSHDCRGKRPARVLGLTENNWGIQLADYDGSRFIHTGCRTLVPGRRLVFGLLDIVLPWC